MCKQPRAIECTQTISNLNSELCSCWSLFVYAWGSFFRSWFSKTSSIGCESKHDVLFLFAPFELFETKKACMFGKVVVWSKHFDIKVVVPMLYLKL